MAADQVDGAGADAAQGKTTTIGQLQGHTVRRPRHHHHVPGAARQVARNLTLQATAFLARDRFQMRVELTELPAAKCMGDGVACCAARRPDAVTAAANASAIHRMVSIQASQFVQRVLAGQGQAWLESGLQSSALAAIFGWG